jgi:hypothetical protein
MRAAFRINGAWIIGRIESPGWAWRKSWRPEGCHGHDSGFDPSIFEIDRDFPPSISTNLWGRVAAN